VALAPGTRLGPYAIVGSLGVGGMGEVYKATDTRLDRTVAIKILPSPDPDRRLRFEREARAIAGLSHPNICTLHDIGHADGTDFLVVEYLEGETLADRLKDGPLPQHTLVDLALQTTDAVAVAHSAGIVHRDLKPSNIFLTKRGQAKVLDFGLAKIGSASGMPADLSGAPTIIGGAHLTSPGTAIGTVGYMSPEQARGDDTDARTDIFSLGAVLYEMATGRPAFSGRTTAVIFDEILNKTSPAPATLNPAVSADLDGLIVKALQKDRALRQQTAEELRGDLERLKNRGTPAAPRRWQRLAVPIAGAALLIGLGLFIDRGPIVQAPGSPIDSIAVLPFINASGTADADYLASGIAGTLTNNLAQVRGLRVVPRTLAARFKNQTVDPGRAGRDLNARAVVTGRVVQRGDRLTIQAELIDAATVGQLWGAQFDRPLADVLSVESEIARAIADNLRLELTREDKEGLTAGAPRDAVAYQLYLRGQYATARRTRESYKQASQYFNQAIERDPAYALAYAGLADAYIWQGYWGYVNAAEAYQKAIAAANRALALNERSADAHNALAWIRLFYQWNWPQSERESQRALALDPTNPDIRYRYGEALGTLGRFDEAIAEIRRAIALDPSSARLAVSLGFMLTNAKRYPEAIDALRNAVELDPDQTLGQVDLTRAYRLGGMADLAIQGSRRMVDAGDPLGRAFLAASYAHAGRRNDALEIVKGMITSAEATHGGGYLIAVVFAALGNADQAMQWLERSYTAHESFLAWLAVDPEFDRLRADPRFVDLIRRIGIPVRR
jgi:TolB-like protein/Tfp pilus assembly protein PilF